MACLGYKRLLVEIILARTALKGEMAHAPDKERKVADWAVDRII
jgi:hypothetical protein